MLALEEYEKVQERLSELTSKLVTIQEERTELLLRIENFTTLRLRSFKESFDTVNDNFKKIFATSNNFEFMSFDIYFDKTYFMKKVILI